ncbi:S1C family serine protease [Tomitella biformata]|uniref:S1C family serine protease n=1 Tax=Tomitella biformata TaxID=630403 RepID=UPI001F2DF861|nr:trypsin-like peptidase domain-containing protein [Tomitella biformata]
MRRPTVDPAATQVFGRPTGVEGSFTKGTGIESEFNPVAAPPNPVFEQAFGRPLGAEGDLQRGPDDTRRDPATTGSTGTVPPGGVPVDPWRDPGSQASLTPAEPQPTARDRPAATPLGVRDVLFGRKVAPRALAVLGVLALLVGVSGGVIGRVTAEVSQSLTSSKVRLVQPDETPDQPTNESVEVASAVLPAVVSIEVQSKDQMGSGSGVVIDGRGYIVTNNHVVSSAANNPDTQLRVTFSDGQTVPAQIVGRDIKTDLAVLKVEGVDNMKVANLGNSDSIQVGEDVVAFGSPLGLNRTVTKGIVSALNRPVRLAGEDSDTNAVIDAVQTDAAINPGNSGGPLINARGEVIGINSAIRSESGGSVGLGFAIPVNTVAEVAGRLIESGEMHHPEIGVNARTVSNDQVTGAEIANVIADGPAQKAGIIEGDVVVRVGDRAVTSADELVVAVHALDIGQEAPVEIVRAGQTIGVNVTPQTD